jgi:TIR domain
MPDLFISYSSLDRPWADRLYSELKTAYPTLDIFLDHKSIPLGGDWRPILNQTAVDTQNLVALWSERAKASNEVGPEIQAFNQARNTTPS